MSREDSLLRGITNDDLKQVVRKALRSGWTLGPVSGTTHYSLIWPQTNEKVSFGSTISDRNYYKSFAGQLERISGVPVIEKHKHGKTKGKVDHEPKYIDTPVPPSQLRVRHVKEEHELRYTQKITELIDLHKDLQLELLILSMGGPQGNTATERNRAVKVIRKLYHIEELLTELDVSIPRIA